jgi:hypothetical protein
MSALLREIHRDHGCARGEGDARTGSASAVDR